MSDRLLKTHPIQSYARVALRHVQHGWRRLREFGHGLRVAGVASFSVALGLFTYWAVPQAQDLFLEIFGGWLSATVFWTAFYTVVVVFWVVPVFVSSRWMLSRYNKLAYTSTEDDLIPVPLWVARLVPPLLATLCLVAVLIGQWEAIASAPQTGFVCEARDIKNAACLDRIDSFSQSVEAWLAERIGPNPQPTESALTAIRIVLYAARVVGPAAALLMLTYLHVLASACFANVMTRRFAFGAVWLVGGGLAIYWTQGLWQNRFSLNGGGSEIFFYLSALFVNSSPMEGLTPPDWSSLRQNLLDTLYNGVGPLGIVLLMLALLASPVLLAGLAWLVRRSGSVGAVWLRLVTRLVLAVAMLLVILFDAGVIAVLGKLWTRIAKDFVDPFSILGMTVLPVATVILAVVAWQVCRWLVTRQTGQGASYRWSIDGYAVTLIIASSVLVLIVFTEPVWLTRYLYRAPLLPVVLGVWIPALTFLHAMSYRARAPLLLGFGAICLVILPRLFGDPYTIRTLDQKQQSVRPTLDASIERWKAVNDCEVKSFENNYTVEPASKECPPPIIVLASGGASRAAFKVAEVLGSLANQSDEIEAGERQLAGMAPNFRPFQNRLFAISAVSGGALAAVTYQATMAEALLARTGNNRPKPPCRASAKDDGWFGTIAVADRPPDPENGWNSCMQVMLAGDFLSPIVVSLIGSDFLNLRPYGDRGATLERSWEERFKALTGKDTLAEPMVALRNRVLVADKRNWLPHLLINGTSVATGRRIITSDLDPVFGYKVWCRDRATGKRWEDTRCASRHVDAYDLFDLMLGPRLPPPDQQTLTTEQIIAQAPCKNCDIRLSTVATMSARFPLLSPHGTIRRADGEVADRVVDGGYFENNGVVTAQELDMALRNRGLFPHIVLITNEPNDTPLQCQFYDTVPEPPAARDSTFLGLLSSPFSAFVGTRGSRATLTALEMCRSKTTRQEQGKFLAYGSFFHIGVQRDDDYFGTKQLSMSWWLSKHVQRRLTLWPKKETWEWEAIGLAPPTKQTQQ